MVVDVFGGCGVVALLVAGLDVGLGRVAVGVGRLDDGRGGTVTVVVGRIWVGASVGAVVTVDVLLLVVELDVDELVVVVDELVELLDGVDVLVAEVDVDDDVGDTVGVLRPPSKLRANVVAPTNAATPSAAAARTPMKAFRRDRRAAS